MNRNSFISFLITILLAAASLTLLLGETPWAHVQNGVLLRLKGFSNGWNPLLDERLPRLIVLICTGASLATAGAVLQSLFHNPLASPSILGISSGGCLAVVIVFILNLQLIHPLILPLAAFFGCLIILGVIYGLAQLQGGAALHNLILTGIAISTLLVALQGFLLYALRDQWQLMQTITEWEAGSSIDRGWQHVHMQLPLTLVGLGGCLIYRPELNVLALGDEEAKNLGVNVAMVRWRLFLCVSLLVGGALAGLGMIAFFGLILPHIVRRLYGNDHHFLIPFCILAGAATLTALDVLLRFFNLYDLSLGNISAIGGGFFFILLLFQSQAKGSRAGVR
jgi:iron complex transport system permease protein